MQKILTFAAAHERFLAHMMDSIFMFLISSVLLSLLQASGEVAMTLPFFVGAFYFTYFQSGRMQASIGMRIVGIYLVQGNGRALGWQDALARYLVFMVPMYPIYVSFLPDNEKITLFLWLGVVWYATITFRPDRAGVHDLLCRMRVIRGRLPTEK
jgi:uncharacterized RDD family membrane protein YckC